jgi:hypothetical protein
MPQATPPARPRGLKLMFGWSRLRFTLLLSGGLGFLIGLHWKAGPLPATMRLMLLGLIADGVRCVRAVAEAPAALARAPMLQVAAVAS